MPPGSVRGGRGGCGGCGARRSGIGRRGGALRRGVGDPSMVIGERQLWWAVTTPLGPALTWWRSMPVRGGAPVATPGAARADRPGLGGMAGCEPRTAAMPDGTGLKKFAQTFPRRCFDVGIAEQHAVTFSAGLAAGGIKPFCALYSTFLQRAYDQLVHDVAIQNLPVRFAIDRAGLVGADGATHAGSFDVTYLATLPNFVVMAAADEAELATAGS